MSVQVRETALDGVLVLTPPVFRDDRGYFRELHHADVWSWLGIQATFRQDNHSRSVQGVVRGLHYQLEQPQGKLISVIRGEVFDVAVDVRRSSPTYGQWTGVTLSDSNHEQLWIPPGFAHGFCVLSASADVVYKCTEVWHAPSDRCIRWSDPDIGITWPLPADVSPIVSLKDGAAPVLRDAEVFK